MNQSKIQRIKSIDIARGVAILIMLGNHLFHATMLNSYESTTFYETWSFLRSFTAPLFLMISGCAIFVATKKKWELHINFGAGFKKRIGRGLFLILVGYILQLPTPYFSELINLSEFDRLKFIAADILRLIGFMLILIEIFVVCLRTEKKFIIGSFIFLVAGLIASPYIWEIPWGAYPGRIFMAYINTTSAESVVSSSFTLFPYGLFVFAGVLVGWVWTRKPLIDNHWKRRLLLVSAAIIVILLHFVLKIVFDEKWIHWRTRPSYFLLNLGGALLIIIAIDWFTTLLKPHKIFQTVGSETLAIYILHLPIVYGSVYNLGFSYYFYNSWTIGTCIFVFVLLGGFMIVFANLWHTYKIKHSSGKYVVVSSILGFIILNGFLEIF